MKINHSKDNQSIYINNAHAIIVHNVQSDTCACCYYFTFNPRYRFNVPISSCLRGNAKLPG